MKLTKGDLIAIEQGLISLRNHEELDVRVAYKLSKNLTLASTELQAIKEPVIQFEKDNRDSLMTPPDEKTEADKKIMEARLDVIEKVNKTMEDEIELNLEMIQLTDLPEKGVKIATLQGLAKIIKE